jgi:predicted transcriptional regulator
MIRMIFSRTDDWFSSYDSILDPFLLAIHLLRQLEKRTSLGIVYDRLEIIMNLSNKTSSEALSSLNNAISLLISRNLISVKKEESLRRKLFITDKGQKFLESYNKEK